MSSEGGGNSIPKASLERARELVQRIAFSLPREIDIASLGLPSKIPFKAMTLRELLLLRLCELSRAAVDLYKSGRVVSAILQTRGALETVSVLFALDSLVRKAVSSRDISGVDEPLMRMLFGGRHEMAPQQAINVLSHIDKMNRVYKGLQSWYEALSEYAHPNYPGLMGSYGNIDKEKFIVHLGVNKDTEGVGRHVGIPALCSCLEVAIHIYNRMPGPLAEFCSLCHEQPTESVDCD